MEVESEGGFAVDRFVGEGLVDGVGKFARVVHGVLAHVGGDGGGHRFSEVGDALLVEGFDVVGEEGKEGFLGDGDEVSGGLVLLGGGEEGDDEGGSSSEAEEEDEGKD